MQSQKIRFRRPTLDEGKSIWQLVRDSGGLDLNSTYCYLLLCRHHRDTCAVAEFNGEIVGFVTGYLPPGRKDRLFIWQIGIAPALRGKGLATGLLDELLQREICEGVGYLEATVGPANRASRALFEGFARRMDCGVSEEPCFEPAMFPNAQHERENLLRIGPFDAPCSIHNQTNEGN